MTNLSIKTAFHKSDYEKRLGFNALVGFTFRNRVTVGMIYSICF